MACKLYLVLFFFQIVDELLLFFLFYKAPTEPIEGTTTKLRSLHTGHKYEFRVRAQNLAGLGEPSNSTKETEIREPIVGEKPRFIQELEPVTVVSGKPVTLTARVKGDPTPEFKW